MPTLSEVESKRLLVRYGVPVVDDRLAATPDEAAAAADELGYPVVVKLCGASIAHKTERGLVRLRLADARSVRAAAEELLAAATPGDGDVSLLVAPHVSGQRELIAGIAHDPQFGATVMLGVGGVLAEAVADVVFRLVPVSEADADEMVEDLTTQRLFGAFRGEPPVDRARLVDVVVGLSRAAEDDGRIVSADLNPLIVVDGAPVAVDALVELR
jgi:acetate---CoA ligase (ADP-forming) subunit beta